MRKEGETRGRKGGGQDRADQGYKEMVRTGWTYGTEEEQNWLMAEITRGTGVPLRKRAKGEPDLYMNKYVALKAIQVLCGMSPPDRNPMGLYRRMEVAMSMLLPGYAVMVRWMRNGVKIEGRTELGRNWLELAAEADRGEYDPRTGGFGKSILELMRSEFVKEKFNEVMENLLEDPDFVNKQLKENPETLLKLGEMVLRFSKDGKAPVSGEPTAEQFETMLKSVMRENADSLPVLLGKTYRKKLRKAMERYDDE